MPRWPSVGETPWRTRVSVHSAPENRRLSLLSGRPAQIGGRTCAASEMLPGEALARNPSTGGNNVKWETPEYTVVEVCAEATGYFYRG